MAALLVSEALRIGKDAIIVSFDGYQEPMMIEKSAKPLKFLAICLAMLVPLAIAPAAQAAGETVTAKTTVKARGGKLFKKKRVPSKLKVSAVVTPGPGTTVNPTKRIALKFPAGMSLKPNRKVCPDKKLNSQSPLGSPKTIVKACQGAVVGTGTATIYLSRLKASPLKDPILVVFNAGKNGKGQPKLKIYGYSKGTGVGILMQAALKGRKLNIAVPVLSFDSAVGEFNLALPGPVLKRPDIGVTTRGKNPRYVLASCPRSPLVTSATFFMGTRDPSTGQPTSGTTKLNSKRTTQKCQGRRG